MSYTLIDHTQDKEKHFDDKKAAQDNKAFLVKEYGNDVEIVENTDDTEAVDAKIVDHSTDGGQVVEPQTEPEPQQQEQDVAPTPEQMQSGVESIDKLGESLESDPLNILPSHMKDSIQGTPAINKRGYAMIAERYGIEASAEIVSYPWDNDEKRCVAKAVATTDDGKEYTGWATACKGDGDMPAQIIELAETRALKRSVSWASGVGVVSYVELSDQLE